MVQTVGLFGNELFDDDGTVKNDYRASYCSLYSISFELCLLPKVDR